MKVIISWDRYSWQSWDSALLKPYDRHGMGTKEMRGFPVSQIFPLKLDHQIPVLNADSTNYITLCNRRWWSMALS